ncbi:ATP-binding protein [Fictibacillus phosphorivorans]|uniref:ATP-binding protein n=1 Tax=Fictibacillus phosphorivorans TaxID=1221500 RepID=UPI00203F5E46|nr:ATP-binding protein [Fictibacillus phosphorivorans]MCM3717477.1 ATP-binding protein [Fictibacillus phosphorivorans]MCM3775172.1 ATP-binding protein [Fictibacillus phosphorivorans]
MQAFIEPLFVNIAIVFSFTHLLNMFFPLHPGVIPSFKNKVIFGVISGCGALACMMFPIETLKDSFFDLRNVPIMIVTLYVGWLPGAICSLFVIFARMGMGGDLAWLGVILTLLAYVIALIYQGLFDEDKRRWISALYIAVIYTLFYILFIHSFLDFLTLEFYFVYFSSFFIAFFSCIFLIERLVKINMQLKETVYLDKLAVAGQMAAAIAHEVRNPMTTIRGMIQFLGSTTSDEKLKEHSPLLIEELDRTNKIITDYLSMVKPDIPKLESIHIETILNDVISLTAPYGSIHNVEVTLRTIGSYQVCTDEPKLKQGLINIIKNGIEAIDEKGTIHIYKYKVSRKYLTIAIEDNGKGMTEKELEQIGLPFYTTKAKGTGLGMMVTFKLIKDMGGKLRYESELDAGTRVLLSLPLCTKSARLQEEVTM